MARTKAWVLAALASSTHVHAQDEAAAHEKLLEAEALAAKGSYAAASAAYRWIAEHCDGTPSGTVAARRAGRNAYLGWRYLRQNGPSDNRIDVVITGDGFTLDQQNALADMAKSVPDAFEKQKLLGEYFGYHNFVLASVVSAEAGIDGFGREADTALGGKVLETYSGHVAVDNRAVYRMLQELPNPMNDGLAFVFVKQGSHGTGGGGVAAIGGRNDDILPHEWGHAFAGLADEYDVDTGMGGEVGQRPNVSTTDDPERVPWAHFLEARVPGIGVYRGGAARLNGAWKPSNRCVMASAERFCPVCREAIVLRIYSRVDPIDGCKPEAYPTDAQSVQEPKSDWRGVYTFEVLVMQPETHGMDVSWWVLSEREVPPPVQTGPLRDRRQRGPLPPITASPAQHSHNDRRRVQSFDWRPPAGAPGRYRVLCRVRDTAKPSGQARPWVLRDPDDLLESERGWWVTVE